MCIRDRSKAIESFTYVLKKQPSNITCLHNLYVIFLKKNSLDKALDLIEKIIKIDHQHYEALRDKAYILYLKGVNTKNALEIIEKAVDAFKAKKGKYPKTYDDLVVDSFINSSKYPFNQSDWSYHIDIPRTIEAITTSMYKYGKKNLIFDWQTKKLINLE